ncbi:MAG: DNA mismatch repair endonuclease MutL [Lachnospiraceae bacterium]|nr:DNA mismatch repair endonuclease MutL [Lachnospiraceae bacterium]
MAQIHVLDSETIDKIAAGEVVERPSSVVKELVENAIDAGATAITVEAKDGGIEFLRIADNGSGMEASQIRTAFLRHATSKIASADDLSRISSLGFRGEALSSIAAVSKVEVITRTSDALTGIRYVCEGAVEKSYEEVGAPQGTTFIMRNLFFNTPVRRKFLKQPATEGGYITDLMEHLALSRPDISFKFVLNNQLKFHTSGNGDLKEVIYRIYGRDVAASLVPVQALHNGIRVEGYLGKPVLVRSNRNFEIYFINGRFIRSQLIAKAIEEGYREYLMQHKFPFCVLHIVMEHEDVDVNVHPTKMDVRFSNGPAFCNMLASVVREALKAKEMIPEVSVTKNSNEHKVLKEHTPEPYETVRTSRYRVMEQTRYEADRPKMQDVVKQPVWNRVLGEKKIQAMQDALEAAQKAGVQADDEFFVEAKPLEQVQPNQARQVEAVQGPEGEMLKQEAETQEKTSQAPVQMNLFEEKLLSVENRSKYRIIGQVFLTYWLVQFQDNLFIIDQHAAHEKVKYERLMKQYHEHQVLSQGLMPPVIVSLTGQEEAVFKEYTETFTALGFEIEAFGGSEYAIRSVPVDLYGCGEKELFLEVLDELSEGPVRGNLKAVEEKIASMSCKAAVKGNNPLSRSEAERLIDELLTLENPYNCPHGRPTIISMTRAELEKKFKRIIN